MIHTIDTQWKWEDIGKTNDDDVGCDVTKSVVICGNGLLSVTLPSNLMFDDDDVKGLDEMGNTIKAHSFILRTRSIVFAKLLAQPRIKKYQHIDGNHAPVKILVEAKSAKDVKNMVRWMHFRKISRRFEEVDLFEMLRLASFYRIEQLTKECVNLLMANLNKSTFVNCLDAFEKYKIGNAYGALIHYGQKHWKKVKEYDDVDLLPWKIKQILAGGK